MTTAGVMHGTDDDAEEEDDVVLELDEGGRAPIGGIVDFSTRVLDGILSRAAVPDLVADCEAAYLKFTSRTRVRGVKYTTNATYWMAADAEPRNALERLALDIFEYHTSAAEFDRSKSGAEWWAQVVDASDDIGFHWDRDYDLERDQGLCVHPHLATVTYLCDCGGPTVVLPVASTLEAAEVAATCCGRVKSAHACWPSTARHLCFDGRLLHGAPADPGAPASDSGATDAAPSADAPKRITFLVNVWLNHAPFCADPLHDEAAEKMRSPLVEACLQEASRARLVTRRIDGASTATGCVARQWDFGVSERLSLRLPQTPEWRPWCAEATVGQTPGRTEKPRGKASTDRSAGRGEKAQRESSGFLLLHFEKGVLAKLKRAAVSTAAVAGKKKKKKAASSLCTSRKQRRCD